MPTSVLKPNPCSNKWCKNTTATFLYVIIIRYWLKFLWKPIQIVIAGSGSSNRMLPAYFSQPTHTARNAAKEMMSQQRGLKRISHPQRDANLAAFVAYSNISHKKPDFNGVLTLFSVDHCSINWHCLGYWKYKEEGAHWYSRGGLIRLDSTKLRKMLPLTYIRGREIHGHCRLNNDLKINALGSLHSRKTNKHTKK